MKYTVVVTEDSEEAGIFNASVPAFPGLHVWGGSIGEAIQNAQDAMDAYLLDIQAVGEAFPREVAKRALSVE